MWFDGDDDDNTTQDDEVSGVGGDSNLGDDIGTRIGEGHDPIEDEIL